MLPSSVQMCRVLNRGVLDIKSSQVSGRISEKCPIRYPAEILTKSGRTNIQANGTNIQANDRISQILGSFPPCWNFRSRSRQRRFRTFQTGNFSALKLVCCSSAKTTCFMNQLETPR